LVVRDEAGRPLTRLQLQKDMFQEATKVQKSRMLDELASLNKLQVASVRDVHGVGYILYTGSPLYSIDVGYVTGSPLYAAA
jgi:hypothetical protein